jgi:hypothetical protein
MIMTPLETLLRADCGLKAGHDVCAARPWEASAERSWASPQAT